MSLVLSRRLIFVEGRGGAGRTTIAQELARRIANGFVLTRDQVLYGGLLFVRHVNTPNLPTIQEYLGKAVRPEYLHEVDTPFGKMTRVDHTPPNDFHERHAKNQSYLILGRLAEDGLRTGKVPIIDGFLCKHITDGSLKRFMDQPQFADYPKILIHVVVDEEECWKRWQERAKTDPDAAIRGQHVTQTREEFHKLMEEHAVVPRGLGEMRHLFLDTTGKSIDFCVEKCLAYIERREVIS